MSAISGWPFSMGSPTTEPGRQDGETLRDITLTHDIQMFVVEVTQAEWASLMGSSPSHFGSCGDACPVESVSWWDAVAYANMLSTVEGLTPCYELQSCSGQPGSDFACDDAVVAGSVYDCEGYRLPTEAEWESAARAGSEEGFYGGEITEPTGSDPVLNRLGWYDANADGTTHPVSLKGANENGLYDTSGNVWEWCWDYYAAYDLSDTIDPEGPTSGSRRVLRGGAWNAFAGSARSAYRGEGQPTLRNEFIGFRLVRTSP